MEIGSEFWLDEESIVNFEYNHNNLEDFLKFRNIEYTSSGRSAISLLLKNISLQNKNVMLPLYLCDSIIEPFEKEGYNIIFYDLDENFEPLISESQISQIDMIVYLGYYGFLTLSNNEELVKQLRSNGVIIIEDITHSLFSIRNTDVADFYIASVRKWMGIPSGGFLASNKFILPSTRTFPIDQEFVDLRYKGLLNKYDYLFGDSVSKNKSYLTDFSNAEEIIDQDISVNNIDSISKNIIKNVPVNTITDKRRSNYTYLLENLKSRYLEIPFTHLNNQITPFFFLVLVKEGLRDKLRSFLIENEVYCPVHWPIPDKVQRLPDHNKFQCVYLYNEALSIPCDQRYDHDDMLRIINVIEFWDNRTGG